MLYADNRDDCCVLHIISFEFSWNESWLRDTSGTSLRRTCNRAQATQLCDFYKKKKKNKNKKRRETETERMKEKHHEQHTKSLMTFLGIYFNEFAWRYSYAANAQ